jgi:topoisomerase-4 subunit B
MTSSYSASDIEVLSGLEPVRRRPGMYTDTTRPNHLAHEVIDNSVDEALAGHCDQIEVTLFKDNSLQVADNGRGMPVDIHPKEKLSGDSSLRGCMPAASSPTPITSSPVACMAWACRW